MRQELVYITSAQNKRHIFLFIQVFCIANSTDDENAHPAYSYSHELQLRACGGNIPRLCW
jgi:hypothetical protein